MICTIGFDSSLPSHTPKMILRSARDSLVEVLPVPDNTFWASSFFFTCSVEIFPSTVSSHSNLKSQTSQCIYRIPTGKKEQAVHTHTLMQQVVLEGGLTQVLATQTHSIAHWLLPVDGDIFSLSNPVDSVTCLILQGWIPARATWLGIKKLLSYLSSLLL